jgi:hypothetical protein
MSNAKSSEKFPVPVEPPELGQKRERLLAELDKQAKIAAKPSLQQVLRKMHDLLSHTQANAPMDLRLYEDVKGAFMRFQKDPVLPPPAIIMEVVEFLQERLVALGFTGQMQWPEGAPPPPPGFKVGSTVAPATPGMAANKPATAATATKSPKDGFESRSSGPRMTLNPETAPVPSAQGQQAAPDVKSEQQQLDSFKTWMKNPSFGKVKG